MRSSSSVIVTIFLLSSAIAIFAAEPKPTSEQALAVLHPYDGESVPGIDRSTLTGKVVCGYQGWFTAAGDGSGKGWSHWDRGGKFQPGSCGIDLWPDVTELDADEKFPTPFRLADGSAASVFSAHNRKTVLRHFQWMQQYGIDGVFVQRFVADTTYPAGLNHCNVVLDSCREGANKYGRAYAVMYDLSELGADKMDRVIADWKRLVDRMKIGHDAKDKGYLHHGGKPVVAVWGIGFNDGRKYTLAECRTLIEFLKTDPAYGGFTVMIGVPTGWRTLDRDAVADKALHEVILQADIVSPWTVGRYGSPDAATRHAEKVSKPDVAWCREHGKEYLPVVFPGFSWHNLNPQSPSDQIPRIKGQFLWSQYAGAKRAGATMIYQAMFDEVNEGTAIFKCTNHPPTGESKFIDYEGLPSDHYLWLVGTAGKMLRGEIGPTDLLPVRSAVK